MKLKNKVAIITGGAMGIGLGCATVFARHGATVVIADKNEEAGTDAAAQISSTGAAASFVRCDVTLEADMRNLVEGTVQTLGQLDCIVNNAGWHPPAQSIDQISVETFESLVRLNLTSTFMGCKFAIEHLKQTQGSIVNMASEVALMGQGQAPSYVATKAGQIGLTKALAVDLAGANVRVNAICPAGVMTPLLREWADSEYDPAAAIEMVEKWHAMGRMATAEEIGEVAAFLASSEASFITGQVICPDGGASLGYGTKATLA